MEDGRIAFKILASRPTERKLLGRRRRRYEVKIRNYLKEIAVNMANWFYSAQDKDYWRALVNVEFTDYFIKL